jgi:hypothetical protein
MSEILVNQLKTAAGQSTLQFDSTGDVLLSTGRLGRVGGSTIEIDSDGQFVGTSAFTGAVTIGDGLTVDNDGATVATFDRATSDGDIVEFQKGGLSLGSIGNTNGSAPGDLYICSNTASHCGISFSGNRYVPTDNTGSYLDNAVDIGESSTRFKDLYLSGGVYLGGTGAANYLDDYEEGTWTPSFSASTTNPSITYSYQHGSYTKIGNLIYYAMNVNGNISGGSGVLEVRGFPFPTPNNSIYAQLGGGIIYGDTGASTVQYSLRLQPNTYYGYIQEYQDNSGDFAIDISSVQGTFVIQMSGVAQTT